MPELPEVETIKIGLSQKIVGLKIKKIQILNPKSFFGNPKNVIGKKIVGVWRKAKILGIVIANDKEAISETMDPGSKTVRDDNNTTLLIHLKMSGQLIYEDQKSKIKDKKGRFIGGHPTKNMHGDLPNRSTRVIFTFSPVIPNSPFIVIPDSLDPESRLDSRPAELSGMTKKEDDDSRLYFNDQRKFGWIRLIQKSKIKDQKFLQSLGPEPLEKEFTWQSLKQNLLKHKSQPVKVAMLDQSVVSGVGNIYASEACFNAKLNPRLKVSELSDDQFKRLHAGLIQALKDGIKYGGSSRTHFVNPEGKKGLFLDHAFVYGREGLPCKVCGTKIKKFKLSGRGTSYCPSCQI